MAKYLFEPETVTVTVRLTDLPTAERFDEIWFALFDLEVSGWADPEDWPDAIMKALGGGEFPAASVYSVQDVTFDWGASSAARNIVIDVAVDILVGNIAYDALKAVLRAAVRNRSSVGSGLNLSPMVPDREGAVAQATWAVEAKFTEEFDSLELTEVEEVVGRGWHVTLTSATHRYEVEYEHVEGFLTMSRIRCRLLDGRSPTDIPIGD